LAALLSRITSRFVKFVHVGALQVFDELQFKALHVGEFADGGRNGFPSGKFRGAIFLQAVVRMIFPRVEIWRT
jgi:hypothetical protein